jgi:hypothetical protein
MSHANTKIENPFDFMMSEARTSQPVSAPLHPLIRAAILGSLLMAMGGAGLLSLMQLAG